MPISEPEWESIAAMAEKIVQQTIGTRGDFFVTGKVIKVDAKHRNVYLQEFGDQPIPVVAFQQASRYYDTTAQSGFPVAGVIFDFGGAAAPTGFLLCDGTSYLRTDYPLLFSAIGVAFGAADGTHFSVPDLRSRVSVGAGQGVGLSNRPLGNSGGEEAHTLLEVEMPNHKHTMGGETIFAAYAGHGYFPQYLQSSDGWTGSGTHTYPDTGFTGGNTSHNNMQPWLGLAKIISTGIAAPMTIAPKTLAAEVSLPKVGESVLVAREMGTSRLPRALGVIQGKNWIVSEEE